MVKLLNTCTQISHHEIEVFSVRHTSLQQFPIIRAQLLNHRMAGEMHVTEQSHQNTVIEWMKSLEVVYNLGKHSEREVFFIPYLATHSLADSALYSWSDAVAEEFCDASVVLFAKLSIPATQQFFYRLIASLLSDILQNPSITRCFINLGCTEAIIPLNRYIHIIHSMNFLLGTCNFLLGTCIHTYMYIYNLCYICMYLYTYVLTSSYYNSVYIQYTFYYNKVHIFLFSLSLSFAVRDASISQYITRLSFATIQFRTSLNSGQRKKICPV